MRVQLNRFEDNGSAVLLVHSPGRESFDVPRELVPEDALVGDVIKVSFARDWRETERMVAENERLLDELLGRNG